MKVQYKCSECQHTSPKWLGKCPGCGSWNTLTEEKIAPDPRRSGLRKTAPAQKPTSAAHIKKTVGNKIKTGNAELDTVLGDGLTAGGSYLLGGDPGVGKSTLALQIAVDLAKKGQPILYISGEENIEQISGRLDRLKPTQKALENINLLAETALESILGTIEETLPGLVIIDSVQTISSLDLNSASGSPAQVREVCSGLTELGQKKKIPLILIGHITKSGDLAGPKFLEHMVDTVLFLEGSSDHSFRILRNLKNRYGSTDETGIFEMTNAGLKLIRNPSEYLLRDRHPGTPGTIITIAMEGKKPLILEIQALSSRSGFGYPRRTSSGFDLTRVQLILGVLQKHAGLRLEDQDIFVNVVGGFRIHDRATDLAVALAIASSFLNKPLPADLAVFGELGLAGEIRSVPFSDKRIREAQKLGFQKILGPKGIGNKKGLYELQNIAEAIKRLQEI